MIGQFIRITDPLLIDELGWHRVADALELAHDIDGRWRIDLGCHVVILVNPQTCERGLPGAGAVVCGTCSSWKAKEEAS